jgi:hypothetical protein
MLGPPVRRRFRRSRRTMLGPPVRRRFRRSRRTMLGPPVRRRFRRSQKTMLRAAGLDEVPAVTEDDADDLPQDRERD